MFSFVLKQLLSSGTLVDECRRRLRATSGKRPGSNATAPEGTPADGVTNTAVSSSVDANPGKVASRIRTLLDMRRALEEVPRLGDAVRGTTSALLKEIGDVLRDPFFAGFLKHIEAVFEADVVDGEFILLLVWAIRMTTLCFVINRPIQFLRQDEAGLRGQIRRGCISGHRQKELLRSNRGGARAHTRRARTHRAGIAEARLHRKRLVPNQDDAI